LCYKQIGKPDSVVEQPSIWDSHYWLPQCHLSERSGKPYD